MIIQKMKSFRNFTVRTKLSSMLLLFALVALGNFVSVNYYRNMSKIDAAVVDAAGRQRMLTQKIAYLSSTILRGRKEVRKELGETIALYHTSLMALRQGGVAPGIAQNSPLPPSPENILPTLLTAENLWLAYKAQAEIILNQPLYVDKTTSIEAGRFDSLNDNIMQAAPLQILNPSLTNAIQLLEKLAPQLLAKNDLLVKEYVHNSEQKQEGLNTLLWILLTINTLIISLSLWVVERYIIKPIAMIRECTQSLAQGNLAGKFCLEHKHEDEIGLAMADLQTLSKNLQHAAGFSESIGQGNFNHDFQTVSQQDVLGKALLEMRTKLEQVEQEAGRRKWATEGIASFAEILRQQHKGINQLGEEIISSLIKYLDANQGTLFMVEENGNESYLELLSMYAWGKKKYLQKQVHPGEGLLGQAWLEKEIIYMTDIPEGYIKITSGLGQANPRSILIVPLKLNEEVLGMMEIASFRTYEAHELSFVRKVAESIAATLSTVKTNYKTRELLEASQQQEEELRAQEEEMRQNLEELSATQEELERTQLEQEKKLNALRRDYDLKLAEIENNNLVLEKNKALLIHALTVDNALMDVAGRNRMLSQKIAFLCELISKGKHTDETTAMLEQALALHDQSLKVIKEGGKAPGLKHQYTFPPATKELLPVINRVSAFWQQYSHQAQNVLKQSLLEPGLSLEKHKDSSLPKQDESLLFIEMNSEKMLQLNNELVSAMTEYNKSKLDQTAVKPTPKSAMINFELTAQEHIN